MGNNIRKYIFFVILAIITIGNIVAMCHIIPIGISEYKGVIFDKFATIGLTFMGLFTLFMILVNFILTITLAIKKSRWTFYALFLLLVSIVSSFISPILSYIKDYDSYMMEKLTKMSDNSKLEFIIEKYKESFNDKYVAILTKKEHVILDNYVINLEKKTYGEVPEFMECLFNIIEIQKNISIHPLIHFY